LEKITRSTFDEKRIHQGERVQFLLPYVENMASPVQISPLANVLIALNLRARESLILGHAFSNALQRISADDRTFIASLTRDRTTNSVFRLVEFYKRNDVPTNELLGAYRSYLSKHLNGTRCEDNVGINKTDLPYYIKEINYFYSDNPLTLDETKPTDIEEIPPQKQYFQSAESKKLLNDFKTLRGYDDDDPSIKESKTSAAWQQKMLDYLRQLNAWDGHGEASDQDQFHQKCNLYLALIQIVPAGEASNQVLLSYIKLLNQEGPIRESRIEWLWHSNALFRLVNKRPSNERSRMLEAILNSNSPVLQVYAELTKANLL